MKDFKEKNISLINLEKNNEPQTRKQEFFHVKKKENSKYAPIKLKMDLSFDYEINNVRFDSHNNDKLMLIKDKNNEPCEGNIQLKNK